MPTLRLSLKMKEAMERLYLKDVRSDYVNMYTADALRNRRLVAVSELQKRTSGRQFPEYMTTLTQNGIAWCKRYLA
jgi:hypothetical protein